MASISTAFPASSGKTIRLSAAKVPALVLALLAILLYLNTFSHQYALDDSIVITENQFTQGAEKNLGKSVKDIFSTESFQGFFKRKTNLVEGGRYRPLSIATFAVEISLWGKSPEISHAINAFIYGLIGLVLYMLLINLFGASPSKKWWLDPAFLITALFIVHPLHTEVVANIKGRDELLALVFLLSGMLLSLRYLDSKRMPLLVFAWVCFFLSLLSKETALPFLLIIPLTFWFFRKRSLVEISMASLPFWLATAAYLAIRFSVIGFSTGDGGSNTEILNDPFLFASSSERLATVVETSGIYLFKLLLPISLSHDYYFNQVPVTNFANPIVLLSLVINLGLLGLGTWLTYKRNIIGYGLLFFYLSFSITSNLIVSIGTTMGERFVFVPSLGFLIALVFGLHFLAEKFKLGKAPIFFLALLSLGFAGLTLKRNPAWKDNFTLFTTDVETSPNSAKVRTAAGGTLVEHALLPENSAKKTKMLQDAVRHLNEAVKIYPEHGNAWMLLGNAQHHLGDYNNSLRSYQNAMNFRPLLWDSYSNAALTARKAKRYDLASNFYQLKMKRRQAQGIATTADDYFELGVNFEDWQRADSAIWAYQKATELDPNMAKAYGQAGRVYGMLLGQLDNAINLGEKAVSIDPKLDWVYENIGIAYAMKNEPDKAIATFERGLQHNPKGAKLYLNLSITYRQLNDLAKAEQYQAKALELDPSIANMLRR